MRPLRHVIEDFLNSLDLTYPVDTYSTTGSGANTRTHIVAETIMHVRAGMTIQVDGVDRVVEAVSGDTIITIKANLSPVLVTYPMPNFYAGTPFAINTQLESKNSTSDKYPLIWLYEIIREERSSNPEDTIERTADIRLFFLDEYDETWDGVDNSEEYFTNVIDGMDRLAEYVREEMYDSKEFGKFDTYTVTQFAKFGVYVDNKGATNSILSDLLSGVELRLTLPVSRILNCVVS